jgi:hypothetical protein
MLVAKGLTSENNMEFNQNPGSTNIFFPDDAELVLSAAMTLCSLISRQVCYFIRYSVLLFSLKFVIRLVREQPILKAHL